ncbi:hypothetical protein BC834DRAFT_845824 [Gloeopeniophorella convolvens]|nr:hypothetical protein BC834DRAFT_845824 [Gloeopeniophorella convolvens]
MTSSTCSTNAAIKSGKASETWASSGRLLPHWIREKYVDLMAGCSGVISSVERLSAWISIYLNGGVDPRTNIMIIPTFAFDAVTSAHSIAIGNPSDLPTFSIRGYGMGWGRFSYAGHDIIQHGGAASGVSAMITAAPTDGIAVIVLANADAKRAPMTDLTYYIARKLFRLSDDLDATPTLPHACGESRHVLSPVNLAGIYDNMGYGTVTLCSAESQSDVCLPVLADFRAVKGSPLNGSHDLFAVWGPVFSTHAVLVPFAGTGYQLRVGTLYPSGYERNITPFADWIIQADAEFVFEDGAVKGFGILHQQKP